MKRITVRYASLVFFISAPESHAGFEAEVEFIASKEKEIGGMTFVLDIESQLDPPRYWDLTPAVKDFKPADKYGEIRANVRTEWWAGDKETQKANKAKYLRSPEKPSDESGGEEKITHEGCGIFFRIHVG